MAKICYTFYFTQPYKHFVTYYLSTDLFLMNLSTGYGAHYTTPSYNRSSNILYNEWFLHDHFFLCNGTLFLYTILALDFISLGLQGTTYMRGTFGAKTIGVQEGGTYESGVVWFCFLAWFLHSCPLPFSSRVYKNIIKKI